jgi:hypothetical protein
LRINLFPALFIPHSTPPLSSSSHNLLFLNLD